MYSKLAYLVLILCSISYQEILAEKYAPDFKDPAPKPGNCPSSDATVTCDKTNSCGSDCECPLQQKCCPNSSCGFSICQDPPGIDPPEHTCEEPKPHTKPGVCPPNLGEGIMCIWCNDGCTSDCQCKGSGICCPSKSGCGNTCYSASVNE